MVDATVSFNRNERGESGTSQRTLPHMQQTRTVSVAKADALLGYADFCDTALFAPAQGAQWIRHWATEVRPDSVFVTMNLDGRPVFALALEVARFGPFRIAHFMGGRHANGNFAAADRTWLQTAEVRDVRAVFTAIAAARPDIDVIALERLLPELDGVANPLACLPHFPSPNLSLAVDLDGGFDGLLGRVSGKRKRKKHRSQIRKFEVIGAHRRIEARTPEETHALLEAFFAMKESRFRKMGIANVFSDRATRAYFHALFSGALEKKPPRFVLHGLEVAGKLRAVTGSSVSGKRLICEFGAISEDELGFASPGDFLFFDNIQEACERGFQVYDFSVGDEPYKRLWCDIEVQHFEILAPLTLKGRALTLGLRQGARLKAFIKHSPTIWKLTKLVRRKAAGQTAPAPTDDES
jgi:CelD/BcsL family acetyltransferase involved in cellulose biosynthesis